MLTGRSTRSITRAVLTLGLVVGCLVASPVGFAQTPADGQGKVKIEWLGHEFYRLTSPKGVVAITSPWLANPDGPVPLESLARTDFILVPNAHNDDMGNPIEIASLSGVTEIFRRRRTYMVTACATRFIARAVLTLGLVVDGSVCTALF